MHSEQACTVARFGDAGRRLLAGLSANIWFRQHRRRSSGTCDTATLWEVAPEEPRQTQSIGSRAETWLFGIRRGRDGRLDPSRQSTHPVAGVGSGRPKPGNRRRVLVNLP